MSLNRSEHLQKENFSSLLFLDTTKLSNVGHSILDVFNCSLGEKANDSVLNTWSVILWHPFVISGGINEGFLSWFIIQQNTIMSVLQQNTSTVIISQDRVWLTVCVMHRVPKETGLRFCPSLLSGICQHGTWISPAIFRFLSAFHVPGQTSNMTLVVRDIWCDGIAPTQSWLKSILSVHQHSGFSVCLFFTASNEMSTLDHIAVQFFITDFNSTRIRTEEFTVVLVGI